MSIDTAVQRLRDANPVPDPAALREFDVAPSVFLAATEQRSREMTTELKPPRTPGPTSPWRRWRPALAAIVVVVLVGVSIVLLTGGTDPTEDVADPTAVPTTAATPVTTRPPATSAAPPEALAAPVDVARTFIEARDSWDAETTQDLFTLDAVILDLEVRALADYPAQYEWYEAVDWRWTVDECVETSPGPAAEVTCTYTHHNAWMDARDDQPRLQTYDFVIVDGKITELTNHFSLFEAWSDFRQWVQATHPADVSVMYDLSGAIDAPRYTPESLALWEQHTEEFVAERSES